VEVRNLLIQEIEARKEQLVSCIPSLDGLESKGEVSLAAAYSIQGIKLFTDFNTLQEMLLEGYE
jgi:hypothetical protein